MKQYSVESYSNQSNKVISIDELNLYCNLMYLISGLWYLIRCLQLKVSGTSLSVMNTTETDFLQLVYGQLKKIT